MFVFLVTHVEKKESSQRFHLSLHTLTDLRGIYISENLFQHSLERRQRDNNG